MYNFLSSWWHISLYPIRVIVGKKVNVFSYFAVDSQNESEWESGFSLCLVTTMQQPTTALSEQHFGWKIEMYIDTRVKLVQSMWKSNNLSFTQTIHSHILYHFQCKYTAFFFAYCYSMSFIRITNTMYVSA